MSTFTHIWYSVRTEAGGKEDFETQTEAAAYGARLDEDWQLLRVELIGEVAVCDPHSPVNVRTWAVGGSGTLRETDAELPLTMRGGE